MRSRLPRSIALLIGATLPLLTLIQTTAAADATSVGDPSVGPHAREEARHRQDRLQFSPARTSIQPLTPEAKLRLSQPSGTGLSAAPSGRPLQREVFGFAPYWALSKNGSWNYSLLSTVAYFGLTFNANGSFSTLSSDGGWTGWNSQDLVDMINRAHQAGDRVVVVVKAFDNATICAVTYNAAQAAIDNTIAAIRSKQLDGVNVDFEGSNTTCPGGGSLQAGLTSFMGQLTARVHQAVPGSFVTIDTYSGAATWDLGEFNIRDLAPVVDGMFVMAYDMNFSNMRDANGRDHAGPTAPLNGWTYNDTKSVAEYLSKAPASKVILGVPYYGYKWSTDSTQPYALTTGAAQAETYQNLGADFACALQLRQDWDATASSPWASWWSPPTADPCGGNHNSWRELYYDEVHSLGQKYDLVNQANLRGTGMWALGYDGNAAELWNLIQEKFVSWSGWESLGGRLASGPDVSSWGSGRLDVFARGGDNALWHRWYDGSTWRGWESLGGYLTADPSAVSWASGRIDIFARGRSNDLIHKWYDGGWSGWESLGGVLSAGPGASSWAAGRLDVFATGGDRALWHRWYDAGGWHAWESLGGVLTSEPSSASMSPGRVDIFGRGGDRALWHRWYDSGGWAPWEPLGGILNSRPDVSSWGAGRLDVFIRATDNALWRNRYDTGQWNWDYLGGSLTSGPGAVSWGVGRIDVFSRGPDLSLVHKWYQAS